MTAIGRAFTAAALSAQPVGQPYEPTRDHRARCADHRPRPRRHRPRSAACTLVTELAKPMTSALGAG